MFDRKRPGGFPVAFSMPRNLRLRIPVRGSDGESGSEESGSEDSRGVMPGGT